MALIQVPVFCAAVVVISPRMLGLEHTGVDDVVAVYVYVGEGCHVTRAVFVLVCLVLGPGIDLPPPWMIAQLMRWEEEMRIGKCVCAGVRRGRACTRTGVCLFVCVGGWGRGWRVSENESESEAGTSTEEGKKR